MSPQPPMRSVYEIALRDFGRTPLGAWSARNVSRHIDPPLLRITGGRVSSVYPLPVMLLTTTGTKSGKQRARPLMYVADDAGLILMAPNSGGQNHPAWYYDLKANPKVEVLAGDDSGSYLATEITEAGEREQACALAVKKNPVWRAGDRTIPIVRLKRSDAVSALPLAPKSPLPYRRRAAAVRTVHTGPEELRNAGGPVTRVNLGPRWLLPPVVVVTSPQGVRDVLGRSDASTDRTRVHAEMRHLIGDNLFDVTHGPWLPRRRTLQPIFTKQHVRAFGGHMAEAAEAIAQRWSDGGVIDVDAECRKLTLRALGHSVLGLTLDGHVDTIAEPLTTLFEYVADRGLRPVNVPRWLPTPAQRRAHTARATLRRFANDILQQCREDPTRDAPLVHALIAATDPDTGQSLSDTDICSELIIFLGAGHDTTATTLAYSLWALGHHPDIQERVRAEVAGIGDRELTPDDVAGLGYTVQVLHEALRLCPPGAGVARETLQDIEVDGYRVPAGTLMIVGIHAMHRDPALWKNPLVFDPERFSPENSKGRDRWQYLPFGGGPRSCIGDHFAMLEATLALATIIRRTEIHSVNDDFPIIAPFTTIAAEPIPARVKSLTASGP